jgi:hypothetical protein
MPQEIKLYKIFLASPDDLIEERTSLEGVVQELNHSFSSRNIKLELIKWETHSYPGIGEDVQELINTQIPTYDVFIGLMWKRFGTPTKRAESGTEEEFNIAFRKFKDAPSKLRVLFYFNTKPIPFHEIDPQQIIRIQNFRSQLGEKGTFYWQYSDISELERYLRLHIARAIEDLEKVNEQYCTPEVLQKDEEEELGIFDYVGVIEESFEELTSVMNNMTEITLDLGKKMNQRTADIERYTTRGIIDNRETVRILDHAARDMESYVNRMNTEIPIFRESLTRGLDSTLNVLLTYKDLQGTDDENFKIIFDAMKGFGESINESMDQTIGFKTQVSLFPNLTKKLNKQKRETLKVLEKLIVEMSLGKNQIDQFDVSI